MKPATHEVICPHCGKHIPCFGSEAAPRAYQAHRQNDCPVPLERKEPGGDGTD